MTSTWHFTTPNGVYRTGATPQPFRMATGRQAPSLTLLQPIGADLATTCPDGPCPQPPSRTKQGEHLA